MHILHIIASVGENAADAVEAVEQTTQEYGNGDVFDWREIGGRWEGHIGAKYGKTTGDFVPGVNQLCYVDNPELFNETINNAIAGRHSDMLNTLRAMRGDVITADQLADHVFGLPIDDKKETAKFMSESNKADSQCWRALLDCKTSEDLTALKNAAVYPGELVFYKVYKLMKLVQGYYQFESRFWDAETGTDRRESVDARKAAEPNKQWITVYDLHN